MGKQTEELHIDRLFSGDRPSIYAMGLHGSQSLKVFGMAIFMVDVLGRVVVVLPTSVKVLIKPRVAEEELDLYEETEAIRVLLLQEDTEEQIIEYLHRREGRKRET